MEEIMAIIHFTFQKSNAPNGAIASHHGAGIYSHTDYNNKVIGGIAVYAEGPVAIYTWETHKGMCLRDREMNGYDDSDFYMLVWNEEKGCPEEIMFATTRGWSYPSYGSYVDATDDVKAKYQAWCDEQTRKAEAAKRKAKALKLIELRNDCRVIAEKWNVNYFRLLKLRKDREFNAMLKLFNIRIKSGFKVSLRNQLINWLNGKSEYAKPFSPKQSQCLANM
jgi:hypothetical protein